MSISYDEDSEELENQFTALLLTVGYPPHKFKHGNIYLVSEDGNRWTTQTMKAIIEQGITKNHREVSHYTIHFTRWCLAQLEEQYHV